MVLGVIEGQIRGGYFPDCILDPSVIEPTVEYLGPSRARQECDLESPWAVRTLLYISIKLVIAYTVTSLPYLVGKEISLR